MYALPVYSLTKSAYGNATRYCPYPNAVWCPICRCSPREIKGLKGEPAPPLSVDFDTGACAEVILVRVRKSKPIASACCGMSCSTSSIERTNPSSSCRLGRVFQSIWSRRSGRGIGTFSHTLSLCRRCRRCVGGCIRTCRGRRCLCRVAFLAVLGRYR